MPDTAAAQPWKSQPSGRRQDAAPHWAYALFLALCHAKMTLLVSLRVMFGQSTVFRLEKPAQFPNIAYVLSCISFLGERLTKNGRVLAFIRGHR